MLTEVVCFAIGDSNKVSTWSGIPYFFTSSLEANGIKVHRVDLSPPQWLNFLYDKIIAKLYSLLFPQSYKSKYLTIIYRLWANLLIVKASKTYSNAQLSIFFTYSFRDFMSQRPTCLLCDWNLQYYIEKRQHRAPTLIEKKYIKHEKRVMSKANMVISLFPQCAEYMENYSVNRSVTYLGVNVVNNYKGEPDPKVIYKKRVARNILFIGREHYISGYRILEQAFRQLCMEVPDCRLDVIGLSLDDNCVYVEGGGLIQYHGFLRKEHEQECKLYYKLLSEATVVVNVNPNWAGYSSIIEAMYYYSPIIVSPFDCFVEEFGQNLSCGMYCKDTDDLCELIKEVLFCPTYDALCLNSHKLVENHTWTTYIERFINKVEKHIDL